MPKRRDFKKVAKELNLEKLWVGFKVEWNLGHEHLAQGR